MQKSVEEVFKDCVIALRNRDLNDGSWPDGSGPPECFLALRNFWMPHLAGDPMWYAVMEMKIRTEALHRYAVTLEK